jgi:hypothetical protein
MNLHFRSRELIETEPLPGRSAVICMADSPEQLAVIKDAANVAARLDLVFNDATESFQVVRPPCAEDARKILDFYHQHLDVPFLVAQCEVGIGRSQAIVAALLKLTGADPRWLLYSATYNRLLYRLLLIEAGLPLDAEPLVSIAVRVKYNPDRLRSFILSFQRQRYDNWEIVAVTDGPNPGAARLVAEIQDKRVRLIETEKPLGHWGHPYRQRGLDACQGVFIGMSNDDNYYVPGYLEQILQALEDVNAQMAYCSTVHSYNAWSLADMTWDLGCWIARASLVRRVPWKGCEFTSDRDYIKALTQAAENNVIRVRRPLFVHN